MKVKVYPHPNIAHGSIVWGSAYSRVSEYAPRSGRFPADHPAAPRSEVYGGKSAECGSGEALQAFRDRGYWASCFSEGDGITWKPLRGQTDEECYADIRECFGWELEVQQQ